MFQIVYADPPWQYDNTGRNGAAHKHYPTISTEKLCDMTVYGRPVRDIVEDDALIFLWATFPMLEDAQRVIASWGFVRFGSPIVWVKRSQNGNFAVGPGTHVRSNAEVVLVGSRGKGLTSTGDIIRGVVEAPRQGHSAKPAEVRTRICNAHPDARKLELFARGDFCVERTQWIEINQVQENASERVFHGGGN